MDGLEIIVNRNLVAARPAGDFADEDVEIIERCIIQRSYDAASPRDIIINMDGVDFIDSSGVGLLLKISRMVVSQGGCFAIYNLDRNVERTIERLRLFGLLNVCRTAEYCFIRLAAFDASRHDPQFCPCEV